MVNPNQSTVFLSFLLRTWPGNKHNLPALYGITLFQLRISTSKPGCKAFDYVKKNGFLRFLQKQGTKMGWIGSSRWAQYIGDSGMKLKNWYSCQSFLIFRLLNITIYNRCTGTYIWHMYAYWYFMSSESELLLWSASGSEADHPCGIQQGWVQKHGLVGKLWQISAAPCTGSRGRHPLTRIPSCACCDGLRMAFHSTVIS